MPAWRGEAPWAADLLSLSQPVDLGSEVDSTEIKTRVVSVAADIKQETSVDYPSLSLPRHASANEPTTAWHWMECSRKIVTASLPPGNNMGRCYANSSIFPLCFW